MRVLMVGVDKQTKGGMWTVVENYLCADYFMQQTNLEYVSTSITGSMPKRLFFTAKALANILAKLIAQKYDIVHVHMAERGSVYRKNIVLAMAKCFGCKTIIHMHGAEFEEWYRSLTPKKQQGIRSILNGADKVLILGKYWEEFICSVVEGANKVSVLHNAVTVSDEKQYNPNAKNLLFLGVAGQRKGVFDLLQAIKKIDTELPDHVKLVIYGPQGERNIAEEIKLLGLQERAEYKGWLPSEKRSLVFQETAINLLPSYNEGLPMTILETMAYGIPNISTYVAAIPEAVNEDNGVLIQPGDIDALAQAILKLMMDDVCRSEKSQKAYEKAKGDFSIEKHIENVLRIYKELE